ncbi:glutathione S-transferase family protein, partial [Salmonella sp. s54412]|uniref:glutathione S-transferase family protein n=1 Tax=Salmonella sp. s54412 TaxID=3160128 RepID=UPI003754B938
KYLGDKKFLAGDELTFVDFLMYELLDQHKIFDKTLVEPHKKLMQFTARIEALPGIAAYKKSAKFIERPINDPLISKFS